MSRKSGNRSNKKNTSYDRSLYSPNSKHSYVKRKTNSGLKLDSTIDKDATNSDYYNRTQKYNSFCGDLTAGAARVKKP